jgi:hypothetical protein
MQDAIYDPQQKSKVTAFQPGFRMFVGDVNARIVEKTYMVVVRAGGRLLLSALFK